MMVDVNQEMYELVYAKPQIVAPYFMYTMSPHILISPDCVKTVSQLQLNGSVIVVEENKDVPDPLVLFDEVLYSVASVHTKLINCIDWCQEFSKTDRKRCS